MYTATGTLHLKSDSFFPRSMANGHGVRKRPKSANVRLLRARGGPCEYTPDYSALSKFSRGRSVRISGHFDMAEKYKPSAPGPGTYQPKFSTLSSQGGSSAVRFSNIARFRKVPGMDSGGNRVGYCCCRCRCCFCCCWSRWWCYWCCHCSCCSCCHCPVLLQNGNKPLNTANAGGTGARVLHAKLGFCKPATVGAFSQGADRKASRLGGAETRPRTVLYQRQRVEEGTVRFFWLWLALWEAVRFARVLQLLPCPDLEATHELTHHPLACPSPRARRFDEKRGDDSRNVIEEGKLAVQLASPREKQKMQRKSIKLRKERKLEVERRRKAVQMAALAKKMCVLGEVEVKGCNVRATRS